ncbi:MAG: hypothetical protein KGJ95_07140 [Candidatus Omnitrophica bacterium]|nr:hypothetical protein [Candidatus Omnitrophota bacterium]
MKISINDFMTIGYVIIRRIALVFILCFWGAVPSFAQTLSQNYIDGMRSLTVNTLIQYGQLLYDRGDLDGARAVFDHVLTFNSHQAQALQYLKEMGYTPHVSVVPKPKPPAPEILPQVVVNGPKIVPVAESDKRIVDAVNVKDIVSLKKAIEAQKRIIGQLKAQVREMRDGLAS